MSNCTLSPETLSKPSDRDIAMIGAIPETYRQVIDFILNHFMEHGYCYARQDQIAKKGGFSKSTVQRAIQYADDYGMFEVYVRDPNTYEETVKVKGKIFGIGRSNIMFAAPGLKQAFREAKKPVVTRFGSKATPIASSPRNSISAKEQIAKAPPRGREREDTTSACLPSIKNDEKQTRIEPRRLTPPSEPRKEAPKKLPVSDPELALKLAEIGMLPHGLPAVPASLLEPRLRRILEDGRYAQARNPAGFVSKAVAENWPNSWPVAGSESASVREAKRTAKTPTTPTQHAETRKPVEPSNPLRTPEEHAVSLAALEAIRAKFFTSHPARSMT